jgi:hypothetical protein
MLSKYSIVDTIEKAHSDRPYCPCGRDTILVYRTGAMWLECEITGEPVGGRVARMWSAVTVPSHVHQSIVEVPAPEYQAA